VLQAPFDTLRPNRCNRTMSGDMRGERASGAF
jgi:hypothetical protein